MRDLGSRFAQVPPQSLHALLFQMGPFDPRQDAFHFRNGDKGGWAITAEDAPAIKRHFLAAIDSQVARGLALLRTALGELPMALPAPAAEQVVNAMREPFVDLVTEIVAGAIPGRYGRCGGMAFAALDLFLAGWPVDDRLGTTPPDSGPLRDFIFERLLDSLEANAGTFLEWAVELHVLPELSRLATAALGALAGSTVGPLGIGLGAYIGHESDVFHLGGETPVRDWTADHLRTLHDRLDLFAAWPIGLIYGDKANPTDQHQILATAYHDEAGAGLLQLSVWDNNHGNEADFWTLDLRGTGLSVLGPVRPVKGVICERYVRAGPPAALHLPSR